MRLLLVFAVLVAPSVALAQGKPRTIEDCELVKEPHLYNTCLASFGPARNGEGPKVTAVPANADQKAKPSSTRRGKAARRGRARAEFSVGGSRKAASPKQKAPRASRRPRR